MAEYTPPLARLRDEYVEMRTEHFGFSDLYAAEFDRAVQAHDREVAAKALTDAADHLETPRMVWFGDGGVTVYESEAHVNAGRPMPMRLTDWLRARAAALGVPVGTEKEGKN